MRRRDAAWAAGPATDAAGVADSARERAAVAEMLVRWQRYQVRREALRRASGDDARRLATGDVSSTFNGFNFSVESVLCDNRAQFLAGSPGRRPHPAA